MLWSTEYVTDSSNLAFLCLHFHLQSTKFLSLSFPTETGIHYARRYMFNGMIHIQRSFREFASALDKFWMAESWFLILGSVKADTWHRGWPTNTDIPQCDVSVFTGSSIQKSNFQPIRTCLTHARIPGMTVGYVSYRWTCIVLHSVRKVLLVSYFIYLYLHLYNTTCSNQVSLLILLWLAFHNWDLGKQCRPQDLLLIHITLCKATHVQRNDTYPTAFPRIRACVRQVLVGWKLLFGY